MLCWPTENTWYPSTVSLSEEAGQVSVNPVALMLEATGVPGVVGGLNTVSVTVDAWPVGPALDTRPALLWATIRKVYVVAGWRPVLVAWLVPDCMTIWVEPSALTWRTSEKVTMLS